MKKLVTPSISWSLSTSEAKEWWEKIETCDKLSSLYY